MAEYMGIPNSPSGLELTIATPGSGNGVHISSSSVPDGNKGSNAENVRELTLLDTFDREEVEEDAQHISSSMEIEAAGDEDNRPPVVDRSSSFQKREYTRLSKEQFDQLEASFQENPNPDKWATRALADTLKMTLKRVQVWFVNRRLRLKRENTQESEKELKRQVELLTNETRHLRQKLKKLKKKVKKLKHKASMAPPPPPQAAAATAAAAEQQQSQVMYVPVLAGLFNSNSEQNVTATAAAATTASFITQQATAGLPLPLTSNALALPSSGGSNNI